MSRSFKVKLNNPALLRWAREAAGYDADAIAQRLGRPVEIIRAWEEGRDSPTYCQLQDFAKKVHRPVAVLYLPEPPTEPPPPKDFRLLPEEAERRFLPEALLAFRELRTNMAELQDLLDEMGESRRLLLPEWGDLEAASGRAAALRESVGVPFEAQVGWQDERQALNEWRDVLFDRGVLVQLVPVPVEVLRAFSVLAHDLGGVGISSKDAKAAQLFSLFHEVAHLCLRRPGVSGELTVDAERDRRPAAATERFCDRFAAAFLLPDQHAAVRAAMAELGRGLTLEAVQHYARKFKVSKHVIARRLLDLGRLAPEAYRAEVEGWRQADRTPTRRPAGGGNYVAQVVSQVGRRYVAVVLEALDRGILTAYDAGKILALKVDRLDDAERIAFSA